MPCPALEWPPALLGAPALLAASGGLPQNGHESTTATRARLPTVVQSWLASVSFGSTQAPRAGYRARFLAAPATRAALAHAGPARLARPARDSIWRAATVSSLLRRSLRAAP